MSRRLQKFVALALSAWLLLLGSGYSAAYSGEIQHDLKCVQLVDEGPAKGEAACGHGCAGHFSAHLAAMPGERIDTAPQPRKACPYPRADVLEIAAPSYRFFPPPKVSLS